jgi:hypothetical protein
MAANLVQDIFTAPRLYWVKQSAHPRRLMPEGTFTILLRECLTQINLRLAAARPIRRQPADLLTDAELGKGP